MHSATRVLTVIKIPLAVARTAITATITTPDLPAGTHWSFDYDADGNLKTAISPLGETESFVFDGHRDLVAATDRGGRSTTTPAPTALAATLADGQYQIGTNGFQVGADRSHITLYRDATIQMSQWLGYDALDRVFQRVDRSPLPFTSTAPGPLLGQEGPFNREQFDYGANGPPFMLPRTVETADGYESGRFWSGSISRNADLDIITVSRALGLSLGDVDRIDRIEVTRDVAGRVKSVNTQLPDAVTAIAAASYTYKPNGQLESRGFKVPRIGRDFVGGTCRCNATCESRACGSGSTDCADGPVNKCRVFGRNAESLDERFTYDVRGLIATRKATYTVAQFGLFTYGYDPAGRNILLTYPDGHTREQSFDSLGRLKSRCYSYSDSTPMRCYSAEYDAVGNPTVLIDPEMRQEIGYDALDRVTEVRRYVPASAPTPAYTETYAYNALGGFAVYDGVNVDHRRSRLDGGGLASAGIPASSSGQAVSLDAGGRVTALGGKTFRYFKMGHRLEAIQDTQTQELWSYDALGRVTQVQKVADETRGDTLYLYAGLEDSVAAIASSKIYVSPPAPLPKPAPPYADTNDTFAADRSPHTKPRWLSGSKGGADPLRALAANSVHIPNTCPGVSLPDRRIDHDARREGECLFLCPLGPQC
jgi:YD repeat-containing protein